MSDYKEFEQKMKKTCEALSTQLATIRAGRANAAVLDQIEVDYYGSPTPIQQVASIATPDPRSLLIQPWDASVLKGIEKAILASDLGINPQNDGRMIRLVFPPLTEERRKELVKQIRKYAEGGKVAVRNIRRDAEGHDLCVVLLHDTRATGQTVKALPDIIQWFREEGYTFCTVAQMQAVKDEVSQPKEQPAG